MKLNRHAKILELIRDYPINTQEELLERLKNEGYIVTQSTVSRDIKSLRLQKTLWADGKYRYSVLSGIQTDLKNSFTNILSGSVVSVVVAQNLIVVKTFSGMASAACAAIDSMNFASLVGSLAGDDTIFIACTDFEAAQALAVKLNKFVS